MEDKKYITIDEALKEGYTHAMSENDDMSVFPLTDVDQHADLVRDGYIVLCDKYIEIMVLDANSIVETYTDDLHENAYDLVVDSPLFKDFQRICQRMTEELKEYTASYTPTNIYLKMHN